MKKAFAAFFALALVATSFVIPEKVEAADEYINVYNWGEYISDGSDDTINVNEEFTKLTGIKVNYTNYASNEDLYAKLKSGGASYDVIIPSDYMIERMIAEDMLEEIDFSNIPNYKYIAEEYKGLYYDPDNKYSVPYNVGLVGLIYNTKMVEEAPTSWSVLWDEQYSGKILMFNNSRDAFGIAQYLLGQDVNSTNKADWDAAKAKLEEQKPVVQSYVMDEIFNKMEGGEAALAPYYAGDYLSMVENNPDLAFVYPEEGTNIFIDAICIPKGARNKSAAELYINFLLDPEIALANAEYLCYASPNTAVIENEDYSYAGNEYLYPSDEVKANAQYFENLSPEMLEYMTSLWDSLKIVGYDATSTYVGLGITAAVALVVWIVRAARKRYLRSFM